jgi:hypothetical protein
VAYDHHAVERQPEVELEGVDTDAERRRERGERVLRPQPARAAVALELGRVLWHRRGERVDGGHHGSREEDARRETAVPHARLREVSP